MLYKKKIAELQKENEALRTQLNGTYHHNRRSALIDKADLPPCKSLACYSCDHIVYISGTKGEVYLLGCGKDVDCPDFTKRTAAKRCRAELLEELQDYLQTQLLSQYPIL